MRCPGCSRPDMTAASRIYSNPLAQREVWANFGWNTTGNQSYPAYESVLQAAGCDSNQYDAVINSIKSVLATDAISMTMLRISFAVAYPLAGICLILCHAIALFVSDPNTTASHQLTIIGIVITAVILIAFRVFTMMLVHRLNAKLKTAVENAKGSANVRLELSEVASAEGGSWVDSNGTALMVRLGKSRSGTGGPPIGYNLIFMCEAVVAGWPPESAPDPMVMRMQATPVEATVVAVEAPMLATPVEANVVAVEAPAQMQLFPSCV